MIYSDSGRLYTAAPVHVPSELPPARMALPLFRFKDGDRDQFKKRNENLA
jgi:hypothetical protein